MDKTRGVIRTRKFSEMPVYNDQAVVLRLTDYSETSQIASLFTAEHRLVRLIAKGSRRGTRKRIAVGLDLLEYGELAFVRPRGDASLGTLTEWSQRNVFTGLRRELVRQYAAYYAIELVGRLTEEYDPHRELFIALLELLEKLCDAEQAPGVSAVRFQDALLRAIGFTPRLQSCAGCGEPRIRGSRAFFSSSAGGMLCRDCETHQAEKIRISPAMLDAPASSQSPAEWFALLNYHLSQIVGGEFKTAGKLRALLES